MSKFINTLAAAVIVTLGSTAFADDDDLFSDVRTNSVFDSSSAGNSASGTTTSPKRITKSEEVREMLKSAGFEAKVADSRTVTTQKELAPWTFPVLVTLDEDETDLTIVLGLSTITDVAKELPVKTLLEMMQASQQNAPVLFAYNSRRERTELSIVLKNRGLTGQSLRDEINRMAILAKRTQKTWALQNQTPADTKPQESSQPTQTGLTGKWSAARSATEAFAVEFTAAGTFKLVYINNGQQTKSSGKFTASADSLSLAGSDGSKLEGKLTRDSDTQFSLTIQNSKALVFTKAK